MTEPLKLKARDELIRLTEREAGCKWSELNPKQQSIAVSKFFVREIHNPTKNAILDDDLTDGLVDGANDLGCDFIYRDDNHVLILQTKYRKNSQEAPESISHFHAVLQRLYNPAATANKYLREITSEIDWENDTFELVFITFGEIKGQARIISQQPALYPSTIPNLPERCDWKFLDEAALNEQLRSARKFQQGPSKKPFIIYPLGEKRLKGNSVIEIKSGDYRSFITAVDAKQLVRAYQELDRDAIFSLNIRNYIGNSVTNKSIIDSAKVTPENFFLYNNGISCLATEVKVTDQHVEVIGLQVINGAQTVKALVNLFNNRRPGEPMLWVNAVPSVLVRITEIPENYGPGARTREKITQYNNTQNTIKISDFRSNDDVQKNLVDQFSSISRFGKDVHYLPKRTDRVPPQSETIRLEEFAKAVYSFLYDPTSFSGSTSFLFDLTESGGYNKVFGDGKRTWERMPEEEFKLRAAIYWISQEFTGFLRSVRDTEIDPDIRASLERKWILLYATSVAFKTIYLDGNWRRQVQKLYKGDWRISDSHRGPVLTKIFNIAKGGVTMAYKNSKRNHPGFVHRNWMRAKQTPNEVADSVTLVANTLGISIGEIPG